MMTSTHTRATLVLLAGLSTAALGGDRDVRVRTVLGLNDTVFITNMGSEPVSLAGWRICTENSTSGPQLTAPGVFDQITMTPFSSISLHYDGTARPDIATHFASEDIGPVAPFEFDAYSISLFAPDAQGQVDITNPDQMVEHVQWKRNLVDDTFTTACSSVAVDAGLWIDTNTWITTRLHTYLIEQLGTTAPAGPGSPYDYNLIFECRADLSDDGLVDFFDISAFLNAYITQDPAADFSRDGNFSFFDVSQFLQHYSQGACPDL
ncbi:MAG: hypothetical protein CMJ35_12935 [Phycisphaerae bacterium]|nr:hypothetical protein [Phycisphaerae bacterium]MBM92499.1 hypothetical protein [Phycisphaerae bacterium]